MVMPDPSFTAIQLVVVGMLSRTLGWDFYKALRANDTMIVQGHQQVFSTMQQGERLIGAEGADPRSFSEGQEVPNQKMVYPTEGVFIVSSPTAIIKGARNPNAAKLFAQFMISPLAQKMIADGGVHAARIDIAPPPGQPALSEMKFIPVRPRPDRGAGTGAQNQVCGYISVTPPRARALRHDHSGVCACD